MADDNYMIGENGLQRQQDRRKRIGWRATSICEGD
jgi:hypothetical protein